MATSVLFGTTDGNWNLPEDVDQFDTAAEHGIEILDDDGFPILEIPCDPIIDNWAERFPGMQHWADGARDGRTVRHRTASEVIANAKLVAASPKLRDACIAALSLAERLAKAGDVEATIAAREIRIALKATQA